jgi:hypothetical protein
MIPNHTRFIEAIHEKKKVSVRFFSQPDGGLLDRICAPMDYGPEGGIDGGPNRYWLWDYASNTGSHTLSLVAEQIKDMRVLGEAFDPAHLEVRPPQWSITREWAARSQPVDAPIRASTLFAVAARNLGGQAQPPGVAPVHKL